MNARIYAFVLDCPNPQALADFYCKLTGWKIVRDDGDWVETRGESNVCLSFQLAPDHQPPAWPDPNRPQQTHIDFIVDDLDTGEAEALTLGATLLDKSDDHPDFRVYADPAGHPFCLCIG